MRIQTVDLSEDHDEESIGIEGVPVIVRKHLRSDPALAAKRSTDFLAGWHIQVLRVLISHVASGDIPNPQHLVILGCLRIYYTYESLLFQLIILVILT